MNDSALLLYAMKREHSRITDDYEKKSKIKKMSSRYLLVGSHDIERNVTPIHRRERVGGRCSTSSFFSFVYFILQL